MASRSMIQNAAHPTSSVVRTSPSRRRTFNSVSTICAPHQGSVLLRTRRESKSPESSTSKLMYRRSISGCTPTIRTLLSVQRFASSTTASLSSRTRWILSPLKKTALPNGCHLLRGSKGRCRNWPMCFAHMVRTAISMRHIRGRFGSPMTRLRRLTMVRTRNRSSQIQNYLWPTVRTA